MKQLIFSSCFFLLATQMFAEVSLPKLLSDGVILQRNKAVTIWGWADVGESITINFLENQQTTIADKEGKWCVEFTEQPAGGPFQLRVFGENEVIVNNIYFGDVWIASGQSNMELTMARVKEKFPKELKSAQFPLIRQFEVPDGYDFSNQRTDLEAGEWKEANPQSIEQFSAVAYFFAKQIHKAEDVPIGIINSALGGSPVESWMSEQSLQQFPETLNELQKFKNESFIDSIQQADQQRSNEWYERVNKIDKGLSNSGEPLWAGEGYDDSHWKQLNIPGYWFNTTDIGRKNGVVWFRKTIDVPERMIGKPAVLWLGRIVDQDYAYINGKLVGTTGYQYPPRIYYFEENVLKKGKNIIAVRVLNNSGNGGFVDDKPYFLATENDTINLSGNWNYRLGGVIKPLAPPTFIRWKPAGLYNAMIHPLTKFPIKGVIWYQGESNTGEPEKYGERFKTMIQQWRTDWQQEFPFYFVQLANFMEAATKPEESNWAALREAQRNTLQIDNTGMAVAIDLGEWNDIHPLDKQSVGRRLANLALDNNYGHTISSESPNPKSVKFKNSKVIIQFKNDGERLQSIDGKDIRFIAISNDGEHFKWAKSNIKGNKLIVRHEDIENPIAIRYAWANNPENVNFYSTNGLPVMPFEWWKKD